MRILCVDDEPLMLRMLEMAVKEARPDADITAFSKQTDLLNEAKTNGCDIAFLDIHMRGMNGVELAKELKAVNPKMNIIFVTGYSEYTGAAMQLHASGYIMKPVTKDKVAAELDDLRFPIIPKANALLKVQCFGNFDVFTPDGAHVRFERSKAKEVFAYLVHKQGSSCTTREIFAAIFEDEPYEKKLQNLLQTYIYAMIKSLKAVGAEGKALVVTAAVDNNVVKSGRNIPGCEVTFANLLNVYSVVNATKLVVDKAALAKIEEVFA